VLFSIGQGVITPLGVGKVCSCTQWANTFRYVVNNEVFVEFELRDFESIVVKVVRKVLEDKNLMDKVRDELLCMYTKGENRLPTAVEAIVRSTTKIILS